MRKKRYFTLSFTAASLRLNETISLAKIAHDNGISDFHLITEKSSIFASVKTRTTDREFREIRNRLEHLTKNQLEILISGNLISQKQIAFISVCKHYNFIKEFTIEVINDKSQVYNYHISETDFNSFLRNKTTNHPELEEFAESTLKKAKQVMFHIFEQVGIIDNIVDKRIQPQLLSPSVMKAVAEDDRNLLKLFMFSDKDIKELQY